MSSNILSWRSAGPLALLALAGVAGSAHAADITVTDAKVAAGRLIITGKTTAPSTWVRLDGQIGSQFNVKSDTEGAFAFAIVYHPGDCIVDLQKLLSPTRLGAATPALVADCGPAGVSPRGPWSSAATYVTNDLVTYQGSTWRARRESSHATPAAGPLWELFAAGAVAASEETAPGDVQPFDAPTGPAGGDLTGTYPDPTIKVGAVTTDKIANLAVTTDKIALFSIGAGRLADGGVTSAKILDGTVTNADLADNAVTSAEIAANSIFSSDIFDGTITSADIGTSAVASSEIANGSIAASDIGSHAIDMSRIDGTDHYGNIGVGGLSVGKCTTVTIAIGGAEAGDAGILTTDGTLPDGQVMYLQRVLADSAHVKVCNLGTGNLPAVTVAARILTFH